MVRIVDGVPRYTIEEFHRLQNTAGGSSAPSSMQHMRQTIQPEVSKPVAEKKPAKYRNQKCELDGIMFDSRAEAKRYRDLKLLLQAGEISWFNRQPSFMLSGGIRYRPDFIVMNLSGRIWVEDVKGHPTKEFLLKAKLFRAAYPGLELVIISKEDQ